MKVIDVVDAYYVPGTVLTAEKMTPYLSFSII